MINEAIRQALRLSSNHPALSEIMDYAVFPAGKLFRPRLVEALAKDLNGKVTPDHLHLGAAIEIHHAYTLVHDDLPAMDNDLIRRGKPSTHAHYGEWKAILAGDALLIASFQALNKINHHHFKKIHDLMSWATGSRGLIQGQFEDLLADGKLNVREVVRVHELKTGRLIQLATLGSYYLTSEVTLKGKIEFLRLGREIGVSFQLLDDLTELIDEVTPHEKQINPFINAFDESVKELGNSHQRLLKLLKLRRLTETEKMLSDYFLKNKSNLTVNFLKLEKNLPDHTAELKSFISSLG